MFRVSFSFVVFALSVIFIAACSQIMSNQAQRIDSAPQSDMCNILSEQSVLAEATNWTWLEITVNVSTKDDVITKFGEPENIHSWPGGSEEQLACIYSYTLNSTSVSFWLLNEKVIGIEFSKSEAEFQIDTLPDTVYEARELYSRPSLVGWTPVYGPHYRTLVWADRGILIEAVATGTASIAHIYYFASMTESEFANSLWSYFLLEAKPDTGDFISDLPKDPFNWDP